MLFSKLFLFLRVLYFNNSITYHLNYICNAMRFSTFSKNSFRNIGLHNSKLLDFQCFSCFLKTWFNFSSFTILIMLLSGCPKESDPNRAKLEVNSLELDFGKNKSSLTFKIKNEGQQFMTWTISKSAAWIIDFESPSGELIGGDETLIIVQIDRNELSLAGANQDSIQIIAQGADEGEKHITVKAFKDSPPSVNMSISDIIKIDSTTAKVNAYISSLGSSDITQHGHVWSTDLDPNVDDSNDYKNRKGKLMSNGNFESDLTGLSSNTTYYIRAYATNETGTSYSNHLKFKTLKPIPNYVPTDISLSNSSIFENNQVNQVVGTFSTTDIDADNKHKYVLLTGDSDFKISNDSLLALKAFDYENRNIYTIRVRTIDGKGGLFEKNFDITITNIDEVETGTMTYNGKTYKTVKIGTQWWLSENLNDNSHSSGNSYCYNNQDDTCAKYGRLYNWNAAVNIASKISGWHLPTDEEWKTLEKSLGMNQSDVDKTSWRGTNEGIKLKQHGTSGFEVLLAGYRRNVGDFNDLRSYSAFWSASRVNEDSAYIRGIASSRNEVDRRGFHRLNATSVRLVKGDNSPPANIKFSDKLEYNTSIIENNSLNAIISTLSTIDADASDTHTYSLVSGSGSTNNSNFNISNNSLRASEVFNYETKNSYSIRIQTSDDQGATFAMAFKINITNINDAPTNIILSSKAIVEHSSINTVVGTLSTADEDASDSHSYSLTAGIGDTDNDSFNIIGNNLRASTSFDYETKRIYSIRVQTNDGNGATYQKVFTINVTNANDLPTNIMLSRNSISENNILNTIIGTLSTTDEDASDTHTYSLVSGSSSTDNSSFNISNNSLRASEVFNYEAKDSYSILIQTNDGNGGTLQKTFTITIKNLNAEDVQMISVTGGSFEMGCKTGRDDINGSACASDEKPLHTVTISSFRMSKYEITNAQYVQFLNAKGVNRNGSFNGVQYIDINDSDIMIIHDGTQFVVRSNSQDLSNYPVIEVTWNGANAYAEWLGGRLPTEAEWEFASRGGISSSDYQFSGSNTVGNIAWYSINSNNSGQSSYNSIRTHLVGTKAANELGFHDMSGNVWEWCQDWYGPYSSSSQTNPTGPSSGRDRVTRGGSWDDEARNNRLSFRNLLDHTSSDKNLGFRIIVPF